VPDHSGLFCILVAIACLAHLVVRDAVRAQKAVSPPHPHWA
jgi:hypothetical protein